MAGVLPVRKPDAAEPPRPVVGHLDQSAARIEVQQLERGVSGAAESDSTAQVHIFVLGDVNQAFLGARDRQRVHARRSGFQLVWIIGNRRSFAPRKRADPVEIHSGARDRGLAVARGVIHPSRPPARPGIRRRKSALRPHGFRTSRPWKSGNVTQWVFPS